MLVGLSTWPAGRISLSSAMSLPTSLTLSPALMAPLMLMDSGGSSGSVPRTLTCNERSECESQRVESVGTFVRDVGRR